MTGQPVWPIVERPVEKGDVPGEWYSPTQPFVTKPPPFERQGVSVDDLIDFTPELRAEAIKVASRYKMGPLFTPPVVSTWPGPLGILLLPNITGGANWQGGSFDPETKMFYIFTNTSISSLGMVPGNPERNKDFAYIQGTARDPNAPPPVARGGGAGAGAGGGGGRGQAPAAGTPPDGGRGGLPPAPSAAPAGGRGQAPAGGGGGGGEGGGGLSVQGLPLNKPPYGRITAIDMNKGELAWTIAHGDTPDNIKNHPALKGLNIPRTGRQGRIGVLTTKTLVIAGEGGFVDDAQRPRRDAARVQQGDRRRRRRRVHAGAADRIADDVPAQRPAVHHGADLGAGVQRGVLDVQAAEPALKVTHEHISIRRLGRFDRLDRRHAVRHAAVVDQRGVEWVGQRELPERSAVERVDARRAARDVAAVHQQHEHVVHAVAVQAFRRRPPGLAAARLDPELMDLDSPRGRGSGRGFRTDGGRTRAPSGASRRRRRLARSARTTGRRRRGSGCIRAFDSGVDAAAARSPSQAARRRPHAGGAGTWRRRPCRYRARARSSSPRMTPSPQACRRAEISVRIASP